MKVFGIGLNKTGTISLHQALVALGFRSLHWGGPEVRMTVEAALAAGRPLVDDLGDFDAYSDVLALSENYALLDRQYPQSRFVLTTRDLDGWIASRKRHVARNLEKRARGVYQGNFLEVDEEAWTREFRAHHEGVDAYFSGRDDLLVMRIGDGDGYEKLCPFLDRPVPETAFPWAHRGRGAGELFED